MRHPAAMIVVCVAIFAFAVITVAPMLALLDAQTRIDALFWSPAAAPAPAAEDVALPAAPVVTVRSPRAPPLA